MSTSVLGGLFCLILLKRLGVNLLLFWIVKVIVLDLVDHALVVTLRKCLHVGKVKRLLNHVLWDVHFQLVIRIQKAVSILLFFFRLIFALLLNL